jgi:GT2 family glycosyltransferase
MVLESDMAIVSIIIVNWNGRHHLEHCLPALEAQTLQPDEIIVVDNNSSDNSVDFLTINYPGIKVIKLSENRGFAGGNIAGYEIARGDYIVLLNNDTKAQPDWLGTLVSCANSLPKVGIVASLMTHWEGDFIDTAGDGCSVTGRGFKWLMNQPVTSSLTSGYVFSACAGAALYKHTMLEDIGFFDKTFFMNAEDSDLAFRAQLKGWKVFFCAESVVRHRVSGSQGTYSSNAVYLSSRNSFWLYLKNMPRTLIFKYAASYFAHFLLYLCFFTYKGKLGAYLKGYADALEELPRILEERKQIQSSRRVRVRDLEVQLTPLWQLLLLRTK